MFHAAGGDIVEFHSLLTLLHGDLRPLFRYFWERTWKLLSKVVASLAYCGNGEKAWPTFGKPLQRNNPWTASKFKLQHVEAQTSGLPR